MSDGTSGYQLEKGIKALKKKIPFIIRTKNNLKAEDYKEPMIGIINLQDSNRGNGTHWCCFIVPPPSRKINGISTADKNYYFDAYGAPPPEQVVKFLKTKKRKIVYNDQQLQALDSDVCGEFCISFFKHMLKNIETKSNKALEERYLSFIYNEYDPKELKQNDAKVMNKVSIR